MHCCHKVSESVTFLLSCRSTLIKHKPLSVYTINHIFIYFLFMFLWKCKSCKAFNIFFWEFYSVELQSLRSYFQKFKSHSFFHRQCHVTHSWSTSSALIGINLLWLNYQYNRLKTALENIWLFDLKKKKKKLMVGYKLVHLKTSMTIAIAVVFTAHKPKVVT